MRRMSEAVLAALGAAALLIAAPAPAMAHQHRPVGPFQTTVGWLEEPAFAGFRNAVSISIERATDADAGEDHGQGAATPVADADLQVEVIFGLEDGQQRTEPMPLDPAFGTEGEYRAFLIPTSPGTYTFHIFGTVGNREFDEFYTSGEAGAREDSEGTYNDMREPTEVQFPEPVPAGAGLAASLEGAELVASAADEAASTATVLGIIGIALGALALLTAFALGRRKVA